MSGKIRVAELDHLRVELHRTTWKGFSLLRMRSGDTRGSMAWSKTTRTDVRAARHDVTIRRGADRWLCAEARAGHELEHGMADFDNEDHHPLGHFCLRSFNPLRSWRHAEQATPELARKLLEQGWLDLVRDARGRWTVKA